MIAQRRPHEVRGLVRRGVGGDAKGLEGRLGLDGAIRKLVPPWHFEMLNDSERTAAFDAALERTVEPDALVLDIGTGAGLLTLLSAYHGARHVVSCEGVAPVAETARRIVERNGYADRVSIHRKWSTDLSPGVDLPERADLLVTEVVNCGLLGEGVVPTIAHARRHLLKPDAVVIPAGASVHAQLVECPRLHRASYVDTVAGFDFRPFNDLAALEYMPARLSHFPHRALTDPVEVFRFDFATGELGGDERLVSFRVRRAGRCHAIALWFRMELVDGIVLSNDPANTDSHWEQGVQSLERPIAVRPGQTLTVRAWHDTRHLLFLPPGAPRVGNGAGPPT
jgi:type III protein arginine methyltransferase